MTISEKDIKCCFSKNLCQQEDYDVKMRGSTNYGEGFVCDVNFATIINNKSGEETEVIIKCLKQNGVRWKDTPVMNLFHREIFIYEVVYPEFASLEAENCVEPVFRGLAKCYGCNAEEGKEMIILENLKSKGFNIRPRTKPYSIEDTKLVLSELAKWHAFSFALQDQTPSVFERFAEYRLNLFGETCKTSKLYNIFYGNFVSGINVLEGHVDDRVLKCYEDLKEGFYDLLVGIIDEDVRYMVIGHGDSWSNNFLFKYPEDEETSDKAEDLCIIDWQCASITPPVFDVAHFLFTSSNEEQLSRMNELLDMYYSTLSNAIRQLGSDPDTLYPRDVFEKQYKKYYARGLYLTPLFLTYLLSEDVKAEPTDPQKTEKFDDMFRTFEPADKEEYRRRLKAFAEHYANFNF